jgi:nitrogenase molybdenum-iron protein NifN
MIDQWVPRCTQRPGRHPRQVNVLAGSFLTSGDLECLKHLITSFGLQPVVIPDISDSLDGHLSAADFSALTTGGTAVSAFASLGYAAATLVIGASMSPAADLLHERTGVPNYPFTHLLGLDAVDALVMTLMGISGNPVPGSLERQRSQLQDTMLDAHFMLGRARCGIAGDPDLLNAFCCFLSEVGVDLVATVASSRAPTLEHLPVAQVKIGDLEDLEKLARQGDAEVLIGNSHAAESAQRLGLPLLRAGFPLYDWGGGYQRTWIGYHGSRQTLFDLANILLTQGRQEMEPYHSLYSCKHDYRQEVSAHETEKAAADSDWQH